MEARAKTDDSTHLQTLPGDDVRQIMWRFADRYDLHMMVQSARAVARGPVARADANGERNTHDWTPAKAELLKQFEDAGVTSAFMDPAEGGYIEGRKNLALALLAFELAWVDAGAATASLAGNLGEAYDRAIAISLNLTFLYLRAGAGYRRLAFESPNDEVQKQLFEKSLEYFAQTARINTQLGVKDPAPYISIARTYSQMGEFFIAIRNIQKAIEFEPFNPVLYGELGVLYHKNRNYETGILALGCAIKGCTPEASCDGRGGCGTNDVEAAVKGLPLDASTVYYYDVYASELAALSTPKVNYCPQALEIAAIIEASEYIQDPNIAADMAVVRTICSFSSETTEPGSSPTPTTDPAVNEPTPTP